MSMFKLKKQYNDGLLSKQDYISKMHQVHQTLFKYSEFIRNTDIKEIQILDDSVIMTTREAGIKFSCTSRDQRIAPLESLNFGHYEKEEKALIYKLIQDGDTIFDIGANIGYYSLHIAKKYPNSQIFAFEPVLPTFNQLKKNISLNNISTIEISNHGFSESVADIPFYYYPEGSGNASMRKMADEYDNIQLICHVETLDNWIKGREVPVKFIKCDVEGAELLVIKGGIDTIHKYKPRIFIELLRKWTQKYSYHPNDVINLLVSIGYLCYVGKKNQLKQISLIDEETIETNFFFIHKEDQNNLAILC